MHQSSVIRYFKRKFALEALLDVSEVRFQPSEVQTLKLALEGIEELQQLKQLHREAVQVLSLDEFRRILSSNGN